MFKNIRLLSFDITKTLINISSEIGNIYMKIAVQHGLTQKEPDTIAKLNKSFEINYKKLIKESPNFGLKNGDITSLKWWTRLVLSTFNDVGYTDAAEKQKLEQISTHIYEQFSRGNYWSLNFHSRELLSELRKQKPEIILAVASNFDERLETILRDLDIRHFFNFMFVSRQCGLAKPDPEFFQHIIKTVEVDPKEYLHIGDDVENDYFPVKKMNAKALILDTTMEAKKIPEVDPNDVVADLKHFRKLILDENF